MGRRGFGSPKTEADTSGWRAASRPSRSLKGDGQHSASFRRVTPKALPDVSRGQWCRKLRSLVSADFHDGDTKISWPHAHTHTHKGHTPRSHNTP